MKNCDDKDIYYFSYLGMLFGMLIGLFMWDVSTGALVGILSGTAADMLKYYFTKNKK